MKKEITYKSNDTLTDIHAVIWEPVNPPIGIIQILHGMNEHIERYEHVAKYYNDQGFVVCGHDILGHGKSVIDNDHRGYFAKKKAPQILIDDAHELTVKVKELHPNLPVTLLGYSFGSLIARNYLKQYSEEINKLILIGSPNHGKFKMLYGKVAATFVSLYKGGPFYRSRFLENQTTGSFKKYYKTNNKIAWMSKDEAFLTDYVNDPLCRYRFTVNGYKTMFSLISKANSKLKKVPNKDIPILILSGKDDPVTNMGEAAIKLNEIFKKKKFTRSRYKTYNTMRHSLFNEVEKDIVLNDILFFLIKEK